MLNAALQAIANTDERDQRYRLIAAATGRNGAAGEFPVTLRNLSETGLLIEADISLDVGSSILIALSDDMEASAQIVWSSGSSHGAQFERRISPSVIRACLAQSKVVWPWSSDDANDRAAPLLAPETDVTGQELSTTSGLPIALRVQALLLISAGLWCGISMLGYAILG